MGYKGAALFNLILGLFFMVLHQGVVVPSLLALSEIEGRTEGVKERVVLVYYTYTPPTFILDGDADGD